MKIHCLGSETQEFNSLFSRFVISPLKKGQSLTIANSLRRVLLSDLQGLAIAGMFIEEVDHEFSTITDVKEDVIDILLNLKQIILKGSLSEPTFCHLSYKGPGIITAKDIELPDGITLVEPNQYIASVDTTRVIEMRFLINSGVGYTINSSGDEVPENFLGTDPIYMPVTKVNYFIENLDDLISTTNLESLILEIFTDGSITPAEALSASSNILQTIFSHLQPTDFPVQENIIVEENLEEEEEEDDDLLDNISIEQLGLSVRASKCLKRASIYTLADLLQYSREDLLGFKNFGQKSANEVCSTLKKKTGLTLD
jgi:DNA-directed RNA polymerase subunit alpha